MRRFHWWVGGAACTRLLEKNTADILRIKNVEDKIGLYNHLNKYSVEGLCGLDRTPCFVITCWPAFTSRNLPPRAFMTRESLNFLEYHPGRPTGPPLWKLRAFSCPEKIFSYQEKKCVKMDKLISPLTHIEHKDRKFLLTDSPTNSNIETYISVLLKENCRHLVRACEPTYSYTPIQFLRRGIVVYDLSFPDGSSPPEEIVEKWLTILDHIDKKSEKDEKEKVAVHCVSGLGRAPVLIAIAMMESGSEYIDTVTAIRKRRVGSFNQKQITFLTSYKPRRHPSSCSCVIL